MQKYQTFTFVSYACFPEEGKIELEYALRDPEDGGNPIEFKETLTFPPVLTWDDRRDEELNKALFQLHLIGGISYYKTCLPKTIEVGSGQLTEPQAAFWNAVYENGLGEFFYRNKIDFRGLIRFPALAKSEEQKPFIPSETGFATNERCLVPIGGGKDSLVTIKLLQKQRIPVTLLRIGSHPVITAQAVAAGLPLLEVKRGLSAGLFDLNAQGALNGHVPITAYLTMLATVLAILRGETGVVFSNERSANEGNVEYLGTEINHQWSKSLEFERMYQEQLRAFTEVEVFSLLRPLSELRITQLFTQYPQYLPLMTSCNENWKILAKSKKLSGGLWCGTCPKCAFVFAMIAAFVPYADAVKLFGKDLFADEALLPLYKELLGIDGFKPFECVGTSDETKAAFALIHDRGDAEGTAAMTLFTKDVLPKINDPKALIDAALAATGDHAIPDRFANIPASA
jgi:UDP-N-acetyl-alpha-D-muramoyl-L-alanyl-L-glutamate epimerase